MSALMCFVSQEEWMEGQCRTSRLRMSEVEVAEVAEPSGHLLHGLPEHLAMECLARVPLFSLRGVSKAWQNVIYESYFQSLRARHGSSGLDWIYALVQTEEKVFEWRAFDPLASRWHTLPTAPHPMEFRLSDPGCIGVSYSVQCASTQNKLVMVAGMKTGNGNQPRVTLEPALEHPFVYDTRTNQWKQGAPFRVPRKWCVCGVADEKLYVASGSGKSWDQELSMSAEVYDLEKDNWKTLQNLSTSKFSGEAMTAVTNNGKLHFVSGRGVFAREGVVYDVAQGVWSEMAQGLRKGWIGPCVAVNGKFYVIEACKLKVYDPQKDRWDVAIADAKLQNLEISVGTKGKIVGIVDPDEDASRAGSCIRILDVTLEVPRIIDIPVQNGHVVAVEVLSMMSSQR